MTRKTAKTQTITIEPPPRELERLGFSIEEAGEIMGMGETLVKELIADGTIRPARFGKKKVVIYIEEIKRVLAERTALPSAS